MFCVIKFNLTIDMVDQLGQLFVFHEWHPCFLLFLLDISKQVKGIQNNSSQWTTPGKQALILVITYRYISLNFACIF